MAQAKDFPPLKNDLILRAARCQEVEKVPVWVMRQAGKYLPEYQELKAKHGFIQLCKTPELCCQVTLQPIKRFDLDAAIIFSDILFLPEAMGLQLENVPGKGPTFPNPIRTPDDLARISGAVDIKAKMNFLLEAIALTRRELNGRCPLFGFSGAPWTLMAYMIEGAGSEKMTSARKWLYVHPSESHVLLSCVTDAVVKLLVEQVEAGAQILQVFDSRAGLLGPDLHAEFSTPYLARVATGCKEQLRERGLPEVPVILFSPAAKFALRDLATVGFDALHVDYTLSPEEARELTKGSVALQGNLDPSALHAKEEELSFLTEQMISRFGTWGYIANLGGGVAPDTDPARMEAFVALVHEHSARITSNLRKWRTDTGAAAAADKDRRKAAKIKSSLSGLCCLTGKGRRHVQCLPSQR